MNKDWNNICSSAFGELDIDRYIKWDNLWKDFLEGKIGIEDKFKLGLLRYFTPFGRLRGLIGSSAKVSKPINEVLNRKVHIGEMFLSPHNESLLHPDTFFPVEGWRACSARKETFKGYRPIARKLLKNSLPSPKHFEGKSKELDIENSFNTTCRFTGKCRNTCLKDSGNLIMLSSKRARYCKTWFFLTEPLTFLRLIILEIQKDCRLKSPKGIDCYYRLNGLSDIWWERYLDFNLMVETIHGLGGFYDYTKALYDLRVKENIEDFKNYRMVYSWDEKPIAKREALKYLDAGHSVSIVCQAVGLKKHPHVLNIINNYDFALDGDKHDGRFADPKNALVLLRAKRPLKEYEHLGFTVKGHQSDLITPNLILSEFVEEVSKL